jgi:hypothetical protein
LQVLSDFIANIGADSIVGYWPNFEASNLISEAVPYGRKKQKTKNARKFAFFFLSQKK